MYVHPFKFTTSCIFKTFLFSYLISFLATFHSLINWKLNIYSNFYWHNRQTDKQRKTNQYPLFLHEDPGDQQALEDIYIFFAFFLSVSFSFSFLWRKIKVTLISHIYTRGPLSSVRLYKRFPILGSSLSIMLGVIFTCILVISSNFAYRYLNCVTAMKMMMN